MTQSIDDIIKFLNNASFLIDQQRTTIQGLTDQVNELERKLKLYESTQIKLPNEQI